MTNNRYGIVLVTAGSKKEGETIASALLSAKLGHCPPFTLLYEIQKCLLQIIISHVGLAQLKW